MSAAEKTETKYELIPVPPCSEIYSFEAEIRINGKFIGCSFRAKEEREMPWIVALFPNDVLGGAGVGRTYYEALLDAFASCVRIIERSVRVIEKFSEAHKEGLAAIKPEE